MLRRYLLLTRLTAVVGLVLPDSVWLYSLLSAGQKDLGLDALWITDALDRTGVLALVLAGWQAEGHSLRAYLLFLVFVNVATVWMASALSNALIPAIEAESQEQGNLLDRLPDRLLPLAISASAGVSLALQLAIIRWQGAVFEMFAFYKNFGVLACFAGLGLGYAMAGRAAVPLLLTIPIIALEVILLTVSRRGPEGWDPTFLGVTPVREQLTMGHQTGSFIGYLVILIVLAVTFMLTALLFVPVGQLCGRLLERRPKLNAYGMNLLGSLAGVLLFYLLSYLWTGPVVWFLLCFVVVLAFQTYNPRVLLAGVVSSAIALTTLAWPTSTIWSQTHSPYQLLELGPDEATGPGAGTWRAMTIRAAGQYYQRLLNLSAEFVAASDSQVVKSAANYYQLPYTLVENVGDVAVVGAGTGNDVAAALRMGAASVEAIEIDPAILMFGKAFHPELPYQNPKVRAVVNDARTHLRAEGRPYDMIVYGMLDSHTLLSQASSVRLDSFVYTVEGFEEARRRLRDQGTLSLAFSVVSPPLGRKIYLMLTRAFHKPPACVEAGYDASVIFLQRKEGGFNLEPGALEASGFSDCTAKFADATLVAHESTDDWPFLYMPRREYPTSYLGVVVLLLGLTALLTRSLFEGQPHVSHAVFFLLGAGFMLVETKNITELGLTFGNTWQVIGVAIAGILSMAFVANLVVERWKVRRLVIPYAMLLASLGLGLYFASTGGFPSTAAGRLSAIVVLSLPLFFSGIVFSSALQRSENISGAMAANLMGAMCGGLLEYNSMYFGFAFLYWIALGLYGAALAASVRVWTART